MNKVCLVGRLTKDIEIKKTTSNLSIVNFTLAVNRRLSKEAKQQGQQEADFIYCVAWRGAADYLGQYAKKGDRIALEGRLQTRSYDTNEGKKAYVTEVVCESVEILFEKQNTQEKADTTPQETQEETQTEMFPWGKPQQNNLGIDTEDLPFF